jgi:Na+/H+ antiporter NhaB
VPPPGKEQVLPIYQSAWLHFVDFYQLRLPVNVNVNVIMIMIVMCMCDFAQHAAFSGTSCGRRQRINKADYATNARLKNETCTKLSISQNVH